MRSALLIPLLFLGCVTEVKTKKSLKGYRVSQDQKDATKQGLNSVQQAKIDAQKAEVIDRVNNVPTSSIRRKAIRINREGAIWMDGQKYTREALADALQRIQPKPRALLVPETGAPAPAVADALDACAIAGVIVEMP